jgi:hypothetical protein
MGPIDPIDLRRMSYGSRDGKRTFLNGRLVRTLVTREHCILGDPILERHCHVTKQGYGGLDDST